MGSSKSFLSLFLLAGAVLADSTTALDNDDVHVIVSKLAPYVATPLHEHQWNRVIVYEQAGTMEVMDTRVKPYSLHFETGQAAWGQAGTKHISRIVSNNPVTTVEIEVKKDGNANRVLKGAYDAPTIDPQHYRIEFENAQVRVLRVRIGPHESVPSHYHPINRVAVYLTDQDFRVTTPDGKTENVKHKAGDVAWSGIGTHKEENLSDKPFEAVITELKN